MQKINYRFVFLTFLFFCGNQKQKSFLIARLTLLQKHVKFSRFLRRKFLTCYFRSCHSLILLAWSISINSVVVYKNRKLRESKFSSIYTCFENISLAMGHECYECSSTNGSSCYSTQKKVICKEHQHTCLTIQYQSILPLNGKYYTENKFKKKCADGNIDCNIYCLPYERLRKKNCKVRKIDYWYGE